MSVCAVITRETPEPLEGLLRAAGCAEVLHIPLQHLSPTGLPPPTGEPPGLALVTSAQTVALGGTAVVAALRGAAVVAVGRKTAAALRRAGLAVVAVGEGGGQAAVDLLAQQHTARGGEGTVWYVGAEAPSAEVEAALAAWSVPVQRWSVYRNAVPPGVAARLEAVPAGAVVTFAAASAAQRYVALGGRREGVRVAVIGASTARAAEAAGLVVDAVAAEPSLEGLAQAAAALGTDA